MSDKKGIIGLSYALASCECGGTFKVRQLISDDFAALRELRIEALTLEGELFGPLAEDESKLTEQQWRDRCDGTVRGNAIFGLFDKEKLIGMVTVKPSPDDASGATALWCQAYLKPEYRGQKLAGLLYQARKEWSADHGYKEATFFIHENNARSREIHEKNGAQHMTRKPMIWPGRPTADWDWYSVDLTP